MMILALYISIVLYGILVTFGELLRRKRAYRAAVRHRINGRRLIMASAYVKAERVRLFVLLCFLWIGAVALLPRTPERTTLIQLGFVASAIGVVVSSHVSRSDRLRTYDAEAQADHLDPPDAA